MRTTTAPEGSLKARRLEARLSQTEVAIAADCSLTTVALYDQGYTPKQESPVFERVNAVIDAALAEAAA